MKYLYFTIGGIGEIGYCVSKYVVFAISAISSMVLLHNKKPTILSELPYYLLLITY